MKQTIEYLPKHKEEKKKKLKLNNNNKIWLKNIT